MLSVSSSAALYSREMHMLRLPRLLRPVPMKVAADVHGRRQRRQPHRCRRLAPLEAAFAAPADTGDSGTAAAGRLPSR